ncbi:MAG: lipoprotein-releasing ABC transporter ATP-binding protein LolD [Legionella sp.]
MSDVIINCSNLCKSYRDGHVAVDVLKGIDLTIQSGERIAIVGPSGSGKSTLLHLLGGLDIPSSGMVTIHGMSWQQFSEKKRCQLRNTELGFIYQFHHLLPEFSALENVAMPLLLANCTVDDAVEQASAMLQKVGLAAREQHKPSQLSGGERQRVAIARALIHQPKCMLADEPTGNLDQHSAHKIFELMLELNAQLKTALVIVTHDIQLAQCMDRLINLQSGFLTTQTRSC